jgi:hypothetical protein
VNASDNANIASAFFIGLEPSQFDSDPQDSDALFLDHRDATRGTQDSPMGQL